MLTKEAKLNEYGLFVDHRCHSRHHCAAYLHRTACSLRISVGFLNINGLVNDAGGAASAIVWKVSGVPNNVTGSNGDYAFRIDTPATVGQRLYVKSAGAWVATAL